MSMISFGESIIRGIVVVAVFIGTLGMKSDQSDLVALPEQVKAITQKVADWQIETFYVMGKYRALPSLENLKDGRCRERYHDLDWQCGALYAGMYKWSTIADNSKYVNWLKAIGTRNKWQLHKRMYHADDHTVGQFYLNLYESFDNEFMLAPTKARFDSIMERRKGQKMQWRWCDALFMAPPVWTRLAKVTGDRKYLEYMDRQYRATYHQLWDQEEKLFWRDKSYFSKREKNGEKLFWSRGNGWVFGGLAYMLPDMPENWAGKAFYIDLFKQMAQAVKTTQRNDGTWSAGMLGREEDYPNMEISGSSFFVFGLAWGINQGILDRTIYEPTLLRGWNALVDCVNEDGMLGYVQPVGASPGESFKDYTEVYGTGAFLAAGTEMYKYVSRVNTVTDNSKGIEEETFTTFMIDGGWCWYQDPRVVIRNGKLVMSGLSGQSGDVKVGVYDLAGNRDLGAVVLHKDFELDDHDGPALYTRPDGSILAVWAKHAKEKIHHYSISSSENYLQWGKRMQFIHDYPKDCGVTYMNLYYMKEKGMLYNFFRDGLTFNPTYITSGDHGKNWGNRIHFIADDVHGRQRPYPRYLQRDSNTVGVAFTDGHPRNYGNSLYYADFRDGAFFHVDGTKIKNISAGPLRTSEAEKIYTGSETKRKPKKCESVPNSAWTCAMAKDQKNNPVLGYTLYLNNHDHRFRIATWNGNEWIDREIAYAGKCLYERESSYTGLMAFDPEDPAMVYISTDVDPSTGSDLGGLHEIYKAQIREEDDISTIKWEAVTSGSRYRNIRPIVIAGEGYKVVLWMNGPWYTFLNYKSNIVGMVLERPNVKLGDK